MALSGLRFNFIRQYGVTGIGLLCLIAVSFFPHLPHSIRIVDGVSTQTVYAPYSAFIETPDDRKKTAQLTHDRIATIEPVYSISIEKNQAILSRFIDFFAALNAGRATAPADLVARYTPLPQDLDAIENTVLDLAQTLLKSGINPETLANLDTRIQALIPDARHQAIIIATLQAFLEPNYRYNLAQTNLAIQRVTDAIQPFSTHYKKNSVIIYEGERVTPTHITVFEAFDLINQDVPWSKLLGITGIIGLGLYMTHWLQAGTLAVPILIMTVFLLMANGLILLPDYTGFINWLFLLPASFISITMTILQTRYVAVITGIIASILVSLMPGSSHLALSIYLIGSVALSILWVSATGWRISIIKTGYMSSLTNGMLLIVVCLLEAQSLDWLMHHAWLVLVSGIIGSMLAFSLLPYIELLFGITTSQTLLDYSNLDHPLLKKLMTITPGTYQHSIMVANLAEAGAEAIHANPIIARIGAYYHDIGKMKRPLFYVENQSGDNPHDRLSPRMSKMIIASHPKDGVELAKQYKLPPILMDFMLQHHGTSLVSFFYSKEQATQSPQQVSTEPDFRYPGPKPQFKESGIVMLADSVEATVRSMKKVTHTKITEIVEQIIRSKVLDNQLSECPLTLQEIECVKQAFLKCLTGIYHQRMQYDK